tara:strand:+ start:804 stop:1004 length:201 start_codon:yes stop_codon:yes gene_type:complete
VVWAGLWRGFILETKVKLPKKLKDKKVHRIDDTRRAILDDDNKMLAQGRQVGDTISWTWIKKSLQD